jgi:lipoic acid synthetase/lipoate-protein ligase A
MTLEGVKTLIRETLCREELVLTAADVAEIEKIEQDYLRDDFIHLLL